MERAKNIARRYTERTGKVNVIGSVKKNLEKLMPDIEAEFASVVKHYKIKVPPTSSRY